MEPMSAAAMEGLADERIPVASVRTASHAARRGSRIINGINLTVTIGFFIEYCSAAT
jgi:hypothetical protein